MTKIDRYQTRSAIRFAAITMVILGVSLFGLFQFIRIEIRQQLYERLIDLLQFITLQVLETENQQNTDLLIEIDENWINSDSNLIRFIGANPEIGSITIFHFSGNRVIPSTLYVSDPALDFNAYSPLETVYMNLVSRLSDIELDKDVKHIGDRTVMAGFAPLFDTFGRRVGVLQIIFFTDQLIMMENQIFWIILGIIGGGGIIAGLVGWRADFQTSTRFMELKKNINQLLQSGNTVDDKETGSGIEGLENDLISLLEKYNLKIDSIQNNFETRLKELERKNQYLEFVDDVTIKLSQIIGSAPRLQQIVDITREGLNLYYVGLYLMDDTGSWAELRAGTGKSGQLLVERGERFEIGEGMIGWVVKNGEVRTSLDTNNDALRMNTPELHLTRSEAILPLKNQEKTFGAISLQSDRPGEFDESNLITLYRMADQIATSIINIALFESLRKENEILIRSLQEETTQAWKGLLRQKGLLGFRANDQGVIPIENNSEIQLAFKLISNSAEDSDNDLLRLPVTIRGSTLGALWARKNKDRTGNSVSWTEDEIRLVQEIVNRITAALDNARLFSAAQDSAERERVLAEVTAKVRESTNIDTILKKAVEELSISLRASKAKIRLIPPDGMTFHMEDNHEQID